MGKCIGLLCVLGVFFVGAVYAEDDCCCKVTGHTTFVVMPQYQTGTPERVSAFRNRIEAREKGCAGALEVVPFGGKSLKSSDLAKFFTPFCKNRLSVSNNFKRDNPDLLSEYFGIYTEGADQGIYNSTICLKASQAIVGVGLTYRQAFWELPCSNNLLWFEIAAPIMHVRNKVRLSEQISADNTSLIEDGLPQNMIEAFKQESWCYGKIDDCKEMNKTALADLEIKFGYQWLKNDCCFFESFAGVLAPTGNKPKAHYLFEPIVGFAGHVGGEIGMTGIFKFWESCNEDYACSFVIDANAWYFADHHERRSFDLKYRPWSRYMQTYSNKQQAEEANDLLESDPELALTLCTPGINVFTKDLCVSPRMAKIANSALLFTGCHAEAEIGYNFFTRDAECVKLASCWQEGPALKSIGHGAGYTNNLQSINRYTISEEPGDIQPLDVDSYDLNLIKECDLDLESAAHPGFITHTFYGSFAWRWDDVKYPCLVGLGGSYEYCNDNVYLSRWLGWAKVGFSF
jgi:hypothetical protein